MNTSSTAIVVGASSGIGEALARRLAAQGRKVALLARRTEEIQRIAQEIGGKAYVHDVCQAGEVEGLWQQIEADLGPVGSLFYAAGVMPPLQEDEYDTDKDLQQVQVNTMGSMAWVNAASRRFASKGSGEIVGISSVAQDRGRVGRPGYNASKAGMDVHLEGVRNRLWRQGVVVTTIRPGFVQTPMTEGVEGMFWVISADRAAELVLRSVAKKKAVAYIPARWRLVMFIIRNIPSFIFRRLKV